MTFQDVFDAFRTWDRATTACNTHKNKRHPAPAGPCHGLYWSSVFICGTYEGTYKGTCKRTYMEYIKNGNEMKVVFCGVFVMFAGQYEGTYTSTCADTNTYTNTYTYIYTHTCTYTDIHMRGRDRGPDAA